MIETANSGWTLPEELHQLAVGGDQEVVEELIALFKQDVGERLQVLREAVRTGDIAIVGAQAHAIKGSAIQMGAFNLVTTCRHMELDAAHHVTENLRRLMAEAMVEFGRLVKTMRA